MIARVIHQIRDFNVIDECSVAVRRGVKIRGYAPSIIDDKLEPMRAWRQVHRAQEWCMGAKLLERDFALPFISKGACDEDMLPTTAPD